MDRFLSQATGLSRSQVRRAIRAGRVQVDRRCVRNPASSVEPAGFISLDDAIVGLPGPRYFMLNKPAGLVCTRRDAHHPDVFSLLDEPRTDKLHAVGRLDVDVTGLVLLTDDGAWSHRIAAPRYKAQKVYLARLAERLSPDAAQRLRAGVLLENEAQPTRPAEVEVFSDRCVRLIICEGRYHQVKRMFAAVGNRVLTLHREQVGALRLDNGLAPGQYRPLTPEEVRSV